MYINVHIYRNIYICLPLPSVGAVREEIQWDGKVGWGDAVVNLKGTHIFCFES